MGTLIVITIVILAIGGMVDALRATRLRGPPVGGERLVRIHKAKNTIEAHAVAARLRQASIDAQLRSYEIWVEERDAQRARRTLES